LGKEKTKTQIINLAGPLGLGRPSQETIMDLSIIIVNYKSQEKVLKCLESLAKADLGDLQYEIIIVDNNSGDDLAEVAAKFPQVKIIKSEKNLGMGGGNNLGALSAKGEYLFFLNPDTLIFKNCSSISIPGNKGNAFYQPYDTLKVSGINTTNGNSTSCTAVGIEDNTIKAKFIRCFPNPAIDHVTISADNTITKIELFTLTGIKIVEEKDNKATQFLMDISAISTGCYILKVQLESGISTSLKLMKVKCD